MTERGCPHHVAEIVRKCAAASPQPVVLYNVPNGFKSTPDVAVAWSVDCQLFKATCDLATFEQSPRLRSKHIDGPAYTIQDGMALLIRPMEVAPEAFLHRMCQDFRYDIR